MRPGAVLRERAHAAPPYRLRVLIVTPWYPHAESPISGVFIQDQAEILARVFDVLVFFAPVVPGRRILRDMLVHNEPAIHADGQLRLARSRYHGMPNAGRPVASWLAYRECRRRLHRALREWGRVPDLVHAHVALPAGFVAARIGRELRVPVVMTEHTGPFSALLPRPGARPPVVEALNGAAEVLAVSPALASSMHQAFPFIRPKVLGNVVRTDFFTPLPAARPQEFCFATVALMQPGKGLDVLLRAMRKLIDGGHDRFRAVIGGDGPQRQMLERLARELGVQGHVQFPGLLTRAQVRSLLRAADVFVLPSLGETFSLVVAEAMACGKPVIATRCGGPEFVVGPDDGLLIPPNDAEALAGAMRAALEGQLDRSALAVRGSVERRFGPSAFLAALIPVYEAAIAAGPKQA
jgi:L-malate glycosyltransferase